MVDAETKDASPPDKGDTGDASFAMRHKRLLLAGGGGVACALVAPPTDIYPSMFVSLALLGWAIRDAPTFWRGFGLGLTWGTVAHIVGMRFVPSVIQMFTDLGTALALLAHVLLSLAQSIHWAIGMGVATVLRRRLKAPLELALGSGVLIALSIPSVFVWSPAGLLGPWPIILQWAEYVGERGVSVLFAIIAALVLRSAFAVRERGLTRATLAPALAALALSVVMTLSGWARMQTLSDAGSDPSARVALVYGGINPKFRWVPKNWPAILSTLRNQTAVAETAGVDLTIWPEAAYPFPIPHEARQAPTRKRRILGGAVKGPILFGYISRDRPRRADDGVLERNSFNSATVMTPDGKMQPSYDKMELLWFGETVPLGAHLPWLRRLFQRSGGLIPGRELRNLTLARQGKEEVNMGMFNCYEDTLPSYGREVMRSHMPNLLVNVTNDAWFVGTEEPELHLRLSVLRSIELRRDLVRAVNLGVPAWIDAAGVIRGRADDEGPGFLLAQPTLRDAPATPYTRYGDWPAAVLLMLGMGFSWQRAKRSSRSAE